MHQEARGPLEFISGLASQMDRNTNSVVDGLCIQLAFAGLLESRTPAIKR